MFSTQQTINSYGRIATSFQVCDFVSLDDILGFLYKNPEKNSLLLSLIVENGLDSQIGNGHFTTYQNLLGNIEGVALIGEKFFFSVISDSALECFAELVCDLEVKIFSLCEISQSEQFYGYLKKRDKDYIIHCEEVLMVLDSDVKPIAQDILIEPASQSLLNEVVKANSEIMLAERGYNPLDSNAERFIQSCSKLIDEKRSLVCFLDGEMACKVDMAITNSLVTYIEGFYVNPRFRRRGIGFSFLQKLIGEFQNKSKYLALLVDNKNTSAFSLYEKSGYKEVNRFSVSTIYPNEVAS